MSDKARIAAEAFAFIEGHIEFNRDADGRPTTICVNVDLLAQTLSSFAAQAVADERARIIGLLEAADAERLTETLAARDEVEKWRKDGDDYGWNFHVGRSSGTVAASFPFVRVRRRLEEQLEQAKER